MPVNERWARHKIAVQKIAEEKRGVVFNSAPFDVIDNDRVFYEVKSPSDRKGKHKGECRLSISEDEIKFGQLFKERFIFVIIFNENKYVVPFIELEKRILRNRSNRHLFGNVIRVGRQITLGKKFLQKYIE